jgi:hypothetical protein
MAFTKVQEDAITSALALKIKGPCPICQIHKRQLMPDVMLLSFQPERPIGQWSGLWGGPTPSNKTNPNFPFPQTPMMPPPGTPTGGTTQFTVPCVLVVCMNCGHTEFYNAHVLGVAKALNIPDPGVPLG